MPAPGFDALVDWCGASNTTQLLVVQGDETLVEECWSGATVDTTADVASVQKALTSVVVGQFVADGLVSLDDPLAAHLGEWRDNPDVTIRHAMSMTTGLDDMFEPYAAPGTDWYYNNNAYHQVRRVLEVVGGEESDALFRRRLFEPLGMGSTRWEARPKMVDAAGWVLSGVITSARDLAAFGMAVAAGSNVGCSDHYLAELARPSSALNPSYGLLWWLFAGPTAIVPGWPKGAEIDRRKIFGGMTIERPLAPSAPPDTIGGLGAGDQRLYVVPSRRLVAVRLGGSAAGFSAAAGPFDEEFWSRMPSSADQDG